MKKLTRQELGILIQPREVPAVSIYIPTHRAGDIEQDRIRLKNMLREAEERLTKLGIKSAEARGILQPAEQTLPDPEFWLHRGDGLAVFLSGGLFLYQILPFQLNELLVVSDHFHIKPLLEMFTEDGIFYLLAISLNRVRFFQCTHYSVADITPTNIPLSLEQALKYEQPEKQQQFHNAGPGGLISFGQGIGKEFSKEAILRFFLQVNKGLKEVLQTEHAPLVLAAVDYLHSLYREANSYRNLLSEGITGNPDDLPETELQSQAWQVVKPYFEKSRKEALTTYHNSMGTGLATSDLKEAVIASHEHRISTAFVNKEKQFWGQFDPEDREVLMYDSNQPGAVDLLDLVAIKTLTGGGTVYALRPEELNGNSVAAVFRY